MLYWWWRQNCVTPATSDKRRLSSPPASQGCWQGWKKGRIRGQASSRKGLEKQSGAKLRDAVLLQHCAPRGQKLQTGIYEQPQASIVLASSHASRDTGPHTVLPNYAVHHTFWSCFLHMIMCIYQFYNFTKWHQKNFCEGKS